MGKPAWIYADATVRYQNGIKAMLENDDLKVIEVEKCHWGVWNYIAFWLSDAINIGIWMVISAIIGNDRNLSWWVYQHL
ncbi:hypothetical protein I4U23_031577 [Adineta vaga]|nr:hypothetical protein I4U23_031577 [Adineta vaga]